MNVASHTFTAIAALVFILSAHATVRAQPLKSISSPEQKKSLPSPLPTQEGTSQPTASPSPTTVAGIVDTTTSGNSTPATEPKESFSQLTLFLFASGLGLFIALLGWSDQIRGIDKDTKDLEERFLKETQINKGHFVDIIKPESPDDQLVALTQAVNDGKLTTTVSVKVLQAFSDYVIKWTSLERLSDWKYNITVALTIALFAAGTASLFTTPTQRIQIFVPIRVELIILILPMTLIGLLLIIIICSSRKEKELRSLLNSMSDMV